MTLEVTTHANALQSQFYTLNIYNATKSLSEVTITKYATLHSPPFDMAYSSGDTIVVRFADSDDAYNTPLGIFNVDRSDHVRLD